MSSLSVLHRKVFHNVNYFLFLFNMILGLMSCVMRLMKSVAVGLVLLPRIERAIMPQGFEKLDKSTTELYRFRPFACARYLTLSLDDVGHLFRFYSGMTDRFIIHH